MLVSVLPLGDRSSHDPRIVLDLKESQCVGAVETNGDWIVIMRGLLVRETRVKE
jgi:hypothetical protein